MVESDPFAIIEAADDPTAFLTRDSDDFVDHDLRWRLEAISIARLDREPIERRIDELACEERDKHAVCSRKPVRLNDHSRSRLAISAWCRDGDKIASPHLSGQGKAASMNTKASASSGLPRSSRACRAASLANSGRVGSGTHMRNSFMPLSVWARR